MFCKIRYTQSYGNGREQYQTIDNFIGCNCAKGGITFVFGDCDNPQKIKRRYDDIEDIQIFNINPAFF